MGRFEIIVDSTSDLDNEFREKYDIKFLYSHISVGGRDMNAPLDWNDKPREDFYADLKADPDKFTTSPPSVGEMIAEFEKYAAVGTGVLFITISSGLSGTVGFALQAKKAVEDKYPASNIKVIDSLRFGPAVGLMAVNASIMRDEGLTLDEVFTKIERDKNRYHQAGWLDDLSFVAKKGRITHAKAFFGTLVGVKPIGEFDYNGLTTVLGKAKGEKNAYPALIGYMRATIKDPEEQIIFIAQTNRLSQAEKYKEMIENEFHPKAVYIKDVYPMNGINIGPGLMAAYYIGTEISPDLSAEREIIKGLIG